MDRNTVIAFILIGLVLLLWPVYQRRVIGVPEPAVAPAGISATDSSSMQPELSTATETQEIVRKPLHGVLAEKKVEIPDTIMVETDKYVGRLSTAGGGTVISWKLKEYEGQEDEWVELIADSAYDNLGVSVGMIDGRQVDLSDRVFKLAMDMQSEENGRNLRVIRFSRTVPGLGTMEKEYHFEDGRYDFDLIIRLFDHQPGELGKGMDLHWGSGLAPTESQIKDDAMYYQAFAMQGDELVKTKDKSTGRLEGETHWSAVRIKYFLMAMIPDSPGRSAELEGEKTRDDWKSISVTLGLPFSHRDTEERRISVFIGPMDLEVLKGYGVKLEETMNLGWILIKPFSIAFYYVLQFLRRILGNYGLAIIIFSIMIKVIVYPLTRKSFESMRKMQELQPKLETFKEKYKKDPQRLNQETMKLYKEQGVNPMGGCLPFLIQMPVFFALFNLFRTTIMLRKAEFLMISDLSAPDGILPGGINLLPILAGITMIFQQRLTGSTQNNPQAKIMSYFMPVFLLFIFYRMSAGLNLYYFMFNILTIAQELLVKKHK